jgi:two-component system, chemotaxis family, CheB/CheR fusion protein
MTDAQQDGGFRETLDYLRQTRGVDLDSYKPSTLRRRVAKRLNAVGAASFSDYLDHLQVHPEEFAYLFDTVLINVTSFFRDPLTWDYLREQVAPAIVAARGRDEPIRIWSAGCASGQEAYSLAMVFAEVLGSDAFVDRVKLYATDVDEDALLLARQGYSDADLEQVPEGLRPKYFEKQGSRHVFRAALRRPIIFGRHDLLRDAPISRLDLLSCRNTLMYFTAEAQERVLRHFRYALKDDGYLFLGRAEMLLTHRDLFDPVDLKQRVFRAIPNTLARNRLPPVGRGVSADPPAVASRQPRMLELVGEMSPIPHLVVDAAGILAEANRAARVLFELGPRDIGRPLRDLQASYRPIEIRSQLDRVHRERRTLALSSVAHDREDGSIRYFDVHVIPLIDDDGRLLGFGLVYLDVTGRQRMRLELERTRQEVETTQEELQSSNEELETTNEELQSTVEELETTNEELQASNEELETMNEELESSNGELQAINTDLRSRGDEVDRLNLFMQSVLSSLQIGVAVLDQTLRVQFWNWRAEDLWGLRAGEVVGQSFAGLDIGLPVEQLSQLMQPGPGRGGAAAEQTLDAITRRGRHIRCRVTATPHMADDEVKGVVILMEEMPIIREPVLSGA